MKLEAHERLPLVVLAVAAGLSLYLGWRLFWFLTDDAYISFRYVSNSILGYGYVWNPPPFRPVEGYTNFLWVLLLDIVWRITGVAPPGSANYLSLVFSFLTLIIGAAMALQMSWNARLRPYRVVFIGLILLGVITNRTFLAWTSSGLETAMFNFFLILWIYCVLFIPSPGPTWVLSVALSASCIYLTRPDGLLFMAATVIVLGIGLLKAFDIKRLAFAAPLLLVPIHLGWRRQTYGEWLPNSYHAKIVGFWPESGIRYALSFILEYALWVWFLLLIYVLVKKIRLLKHGASAEPTTAPASRDELRPLLTAVVVSTLIIHALYYALIGGDHFEYRVYSHLILLAFISFVWMLNAADMKLLPSIAALAAFILLSYPIPWTHWALTHRLETRQETFRLKMPVADHFPKPFAWYAQCFDNLQSWLIDRSVCMRHQEHKAFHLYQLMIYPSRKVGLSLPSDDFPVYVCASVGVPAWVLPKINIIDKLGLNDYIIARNPYSPEKVADRRNPFGLRQMGHDRRPPDGYLECFMPDVVLLDKKEIIMLPRQRKLTAEDITYCEKVWAEAVDKS